MGFRDSPGLRFAFISCAALVFLVANAAPAQEADRFEYLRKDERLSAELTLRLNGEALKDVVDIIEAATGAKISVDSDIAEDKVTVFCKGQPASEVMIQIARLFGYHFRPQRMAGELRYTLFRDDATRALEHKLKRGALDEAFEKIGKGVARYAAEAQTEESFSEMRKASAEKVREAMEMTPDSLEQITDEMIEKMRPLWEDLMFSGFCLPNRGIPLLYSRLNSEQIEMLKGERRVVFSSGGYPGAYPMPDDLAQVLAEGRPGSWSLGLEDEGALEGFDYGQYEDEMIEEHGPIVGARATFRCEAQELFAQMITLQVEVRRIHQDGAESPGEMGFLVMPIGKDFAEIIEESLALYRGATGTHKAGESDAPEELSDPVFQTKVKVASRPGWLADDVETEEAEDSAQPEPGTRSKTSPAGVFRERGLYTISHLIEDLAPQVPVSMIADHYDQMYAIPAMGDTFGQLVLSMRLSGREATMEGDWLRLRNKTWYFDRSASIPNHLILRWVELEKVKGGFDLSTLAEMALLSKDQLKNISGWGTAGLSMVFELAGETYIDRAGWNWIKGFALSPSDQQRRLLSGDSIPLAALPLEAQQALMEALLDEEEAGWNGRALRQAAFSVSQRQGKEYTLRPGASAVEEVVEMSGVQIGEESFESWLEDLQSLDPSIQRDDFDVSTATTIDFHLTSGDMSADESIRLPLDTGESKGEPTNEL